MLVVAGAEFGEDAFPVGRNDGVQVGAEIGLRVLREDGSGHVVTIDGDRVLAASCRSVRWAACAAGRAAIDRIARARRMREDDMRMKRELGRGGCLRGARLRLPLVVGIRRHHRGGNLAAPVVEQGGELADALGLLAGEIALLAEIVAEVEELDGVVLEILEELVVALADGAAGLCIP